MTRTKKQKSQQKNICGININLWILFVLFVMVRVFVSHPYYFVAGDEGRYLGLAQSFPSHTLYGDHILFLQHGPVYAYAIHLMNLLVDNDLLAGMLVSLIAAMITFFVAIRFLRLLGKGDNWIFFFMLFFSLSYNLTQLSTFIYYESLYLLIFISSITLFLSYLKEGKEHALVCSAILGVIFAFATDKVIFLIPILASMIFFHSKDKRKILQYLTIALICLAYGMVLLIRLNSFMTHEYEPIGVDGLIEDVRNFGPGQLLSPFSFSEGQKFAPFGFSINPVQMMAAVGYLINVIPFSIPVILNRADVMQIVTPKYILFSIFIYIPIIFLIAYGFFKGMKKVSENNLFMAFFGLVCAFPFISGIANSRHLVMISIPLFYFFAEGVTLLIPKMGKRVKAIFTFDGKRSSKTLICIFLIVALCFLPYNHSFTLGRQKIVQGNAVAAYVTLLPKEGVFVQTGYSMEQAYLLDKEVYGLVADTDNMLKYIEYFDINYVVIGSKRWTAIDEPSIAYVKSHPEKFKLISTIPETYPFPEKGDTFYVYEIQR